MVDPFFDFVNLDIETWRNDTSLVETSVELDNDLSTAVVIDDSEITDISILLHALKEFDCDLRSWADEDLAFSCTLGIDD